MKVKYLGILLFAILAFYGCDDNTGTLGMSMLPDSDGISATTTTFDVTTKSIRAKMFMPRRVQGISVSLLMLIPKDLEVMKLAF